MNRECRAGTTWAEAEEMLNETCTWDAIRADSGTCDANVGLSELIRDSIFSASLLQASICSGLGFWSTGMMRITISDSMLKYPNTSHCGTDTCRRIFSSMSSTVIGFLFVTLAKLSSLSLSYKILSIPAHSGQQAPMWIKKISVIKTSSLLSKQESKFEY